MEGYPQKPGENLSQTPQIEKEKAQAPIKQQQI